MATERALSQRRLVVAGTTLGVGLGGLFDGIVFHQVLQWHHLISGPQPATSLAGLELNTLADGLFHVAGWVLTFAGVWLLVAAAEARARSTARRVIAGSLLVGWGAFNLVEGVVDHYLLQIHHVRPGPDEALYDAAFLVWGGLFVVVGRWLVGSVNRAGKRL